MFLKLAALVLCITYVACEEYVQIHPLPPKEVEIQDHKNGSTIEVREAERIVLACKPAAKLKWYKNGVLPQGGSYHPREETTGGRVHTTHSTITAYVIMDDNGATYSCESIHKAMRQPLKAKITIDVLLPPKEVKIQKHKDGSTLKVRKAERIALTCTSRHSKPAAKLKWYRNGVLLQGGSYHPLEETTGGRVHTTHSTITVYVIMDDNGATYTCESIHKERQQPLKAKITIDVLYPPSIPEIEGYQEGDIVQVGDTLTLACIVRGGNPRAHLVWFRDNVQVDASFSTSGREVTNVHTFTVDETDNDAIYRCEAVNAVTYHPRIANVKLSVHYPPSAPSIVGYLLAKESWTEESLVEEGMPIRVGDYLKLTCVANGGNPLATLRWFTRDREVHAVTSISGSDVFSELVIRADASNNGVVFRCEAINSATDKPLFAKIKLKVDCKPDPPGKFRAQIATTDGVLLSWSPGFNGGSPQFFRIRYRAKGGTDTAVPISTVDVLQTNASSFVVTGLEPGTEYSFWLMAWNVYGESDYTKREVTAHTTARLEEG